VAASAAYARNLEPTESLSRIRRWAGIGRQGSNIALATGDLATEFESGQPLAVLFGRKLLRDASVGPAMMGTLVLLDLMGGVALLLRGLHMVNSGILRAFGPDLRHLLSKAVGNRFAAFAAGLGEIAAKKIKRKLQFSPEGAAELTAFHKRVLESLKIAFAVFMSGDVIEARKLIAEKAELRTAELAAAERHLERLREGRPETLETTSLHLDVLRDLKRLHSHICSVAYPVLDMAGETLTLASPSKPTAQ
jgi:hypothetical protein